MYNIWFNWVWYDDDDNAGLIHLLRRIGMISRDLLSSNKEILEKPLSAELRVQRYTYLFSLLQIYNRLFCSLYWLYLLWYFGIIFGSFVLLTLLGFSKCLASLDQSAVIFYFNLVKFYLKWNEIDCITWELLWLGFNFIGITSS